MYRPQLAFLAMALGAPSSAYAQESYNIQNVARLDILPGYATKEGHMVAARIKLKPGWKTYWRSPGGNGIPPTFNWAGSLNLRAVTFHWPAPNVFVEKGVQTIGYKDQLVLPIGIIPVQNGKPVAVQGTVSFGVCEEVCLPVKASFKLDVHGATKSHQSEIRAALKDKPLNAKSAGLSGLKCKITPIEDGFNIIATLKSQKPVSPGTISVIEVPNADVWVEQDLFSVSGTTIKASANLYAYGDAPMILDRSKITLNLLGGNRAIELRGCPS